MAAIRGHPGRHPGPPSGATHKSEYSDSLAGDFACRDWVRPQAGLRFTNPIRGHPQIRLFRQSGVLSTPAATGADQKWEFVPAFSATRHDPPMVVLSAAPIRVISEPVPSKRWIRPTRREAYSEEVLDRMPAIRARRESATQRAPLHRHHDTDCRRLRSLFGRVVGITLKLVRRRTRLPDLWCGRHTRRNAPHRGSEPDSAAGVMAALSSGIRNQESAHAS